MSDLINPLDVIHEKSQSVKDLGRVRVNCSFRRRAFFNRKYIVDLYLSRALLVLLSPVILLLWVLVKLTSKGPGFYRQPRIGLNGREFELFKLRSMVRDAENDGQPIWCTKQDDRVTKVGRVLRALHLDELPQLLNVSQGDMCLVGPRPERPMICEELAMEIDGYFDRVTVRPGITGLAQINLPPDTSLGDVKRKQVLDLTYINQTNAWFELRILIASGLRMLGIKGETTMKLMSLCRRSLLDDMGLSPESSENVRSASHPLAPKVRANGKMNGQANGQATGNKKPVPHGNPRKQTATIHVLDPCEIDLDCDSLDSGIDSGIGLIN